MTRDIEADMDYPQPTTPPPSRDRRKSGKPKARSATTEQFDDWSEAFSVCRERGRPLLAQVGADVLKVFPSGRAEPRGRVHVPKNIVDAPCPRCHGRGELCYTCQQPPSGCDCENRFATVTACSACDGRGTVEAEVPARDYAGEMRELFEFCRK